MLITSAAGRGMIEGFEGVVLRKYLDEARIWTIGVGHRLLPGEDYPNGITRVQADDMLAHDLAKAEACVWSFVDPNIGQNMFDALVSLGFNIGTAAERVSTVAKMMQAGAYAAAADAFLMWNKVERDGTLVVSANLTRRRATERAVFLRDVSGIDPAA